MAYISDAERARDHWMTYPDLIAFVSRTVGCSCKDADQQARNALSDGKLIIVWEDALLPGCRDHAAGPTPRLDFPPKDGAFWQQAVVRDDEVFDPATERWRTLLILRSVVPRVWQEQPPDPLPPAEGSRRKGGRPSFGDKIKQKLSGYEPTSVADAVRHVQATWSDNDGPPPHDETIRRWFRKQRTDKTQQN